MFPLKKLAGSVALLAALQLGAEDGKPAQNLPWWWVKLDGDLFAAQPTKDPVVIRDADAAETALTPWHPGLDGRGRKPPAAPLPTDIDYAKHMVVVITADGGPSSDWDVVAVESNGKEIVVRMAREDGVRGGRQGLVALVLQLPESDLPVRVEWTKEKLAEVRDKRDCATKGVHEGVTAIGACTVCRKETPSQSMKFCQACSDVRQACAYCGKRVAGERPTKK
ncbi:MAG: hypothetical protein HYY18_00540 [Planctomycetes bacterium]|nr:hypothetical protein [Planctomycetota bacterium]